MDIELVMDPGGGAFYGPKISVQARDAIGRTWQMSTIQVDFQLPQRFDMSYIGPDGERHRPIMIHRALFGSVERFFAVLRRALRGGVPGVAGARCRSRCCRWPRRTPTTPTRLAAELRGHGFRVEVVAADETLGNRIRRAKGEKVPYVLVVGDDDVAHRTVGVNPRGNEVERDVPLGVVRRAPGRRRRGQEVSAGHRAARPAVGHLAVQLRHRA